MQSDLCGSEKFSFQLFDSKRYRVVLRREMTDEEMKRSNRHFISSRCPNLQWIKENQSAVRRYKISRGEN
ncbi:MAG: hypothetical protein WA584_23555 [Pyrinomonadaceae bacterium]